MSDRIHLGALSSFFSAFSFRHFLFRSTSPHKLAADGDTINLKKTPREEKTPTPNPDRALEGYISFLGMVLLLLLSIGG